MVQENTVQAYVEALIGSRRLGDQVVCHRVLPARPAAFQRPRDPLSARLSTAVRAGGMPTLYRHQARALDHIRDGRHVVVATPTASGKSLIYNLAYLERFLEEPTARALYLFPLKALAQDQLGGFNRLAARLNGRKPTAAIYDGDTSAWHRKRIREHPPNVIMTNPEMLHLSFLAHHVKWDEFLSELKLVVVDEVHTYRGVMGSHMAQVFRRLRRICSRHGADPLFIFNSATVANPAELAHQLTDLTSRAVLESGAPRGKRHTLFIDPLDGPAQTAILLLHAALRRGLRTIIYTQSRKMTELIALWAQTRAGQYADRISAYRAGFLPQERRHIEGRLANGDLLAVVSTSALELGIDIGELDLCLLVGYPGTVVSTLQRGGRVGRSGRESAVILIAGEDALDQYFMRHPDDFFNRAPEAAVVNPYNPAILARHTVCAAAELPLGRDEEFVTRHKAVKAAVAGLERAGELLRSADGREWFAARKNPQRHVELRGAGRRFQIVATQDGAGKGEIDAIRALKETHTGAVYLHGSKMYLVDELSLETNTVYVSPQDVDFYTRVRSNKNTQILEVLDEKAVKGIRAGYGRIRVTEKITGFERWRIRTKKMISREPLDLPEQTFETEGLWFAIPQTIARAVEARYLHFMGGIHAMEHAFIGMFPLLVMADRNDLGGISTPLHPQIECAAVFVYDAVYGGAGLSRQAFAAAENLLSTTLKAVMSCPCENGCPSCVHSPKCGAGNRPIDKRAAVFILKTIQRSAPPDNKAALPTAQAPPVTPSEAPAAADEKRNAAAAAGPAKPPKKRAAARAQLKSSGPAGRGRRLRQARLRQRRGKDRRRSPLEDGVVSGGAPPAKAAGQIVRFGVFDLETQLSARDVGGWHRAARMRVSCAVLYDSVEDVYRSYTEEQVPQLIQRFEHYDWIVGFNSRRFDYRVLSAYTDIDFSQLPSLDILEEVKQHLGYRLSLDHLAGATLGEHKTGDGLKALRWWKEGRLAELMDYCRQDVRITWELLRFGMRHGFLLFTNKAGQAVRLPVNWRERFQRRSGPADCHMDIS